MKVVGPEGWAQGERGQLGSAGRARQGGGFVRRKVEGTEGLEARNPFSSHQGKHRLGGTKVGVPSRLPQNPGDG